MRIWNPQHLPRGEHSFNMTVEPAFSQDNWAERNATRAFIASLQLQKVQTLRTTHLTIGAFSLVVAILTVHLILLDARRAHRLQIASGVHLRFLQSINTAEVFPLVLTVGAVVQQTVFVAAQGSALDRVSTRHCRGLAMITFPAMFLMGYLTLVFGIEMALRAVKRTPFASRGRWTVAWCCGIVFSLLLLTWLPTIIWPMPRRCLGSLIWFPVRYETIAIGILSVLIFCCLFLAALIGVQLKRTRNVLDNERIAASRMCYYLLLTALVYTLILPVEIQAHRREFMKTYATSRMAEISLFSSGLLIGLFHLFLRANALRTVISPCSQSLPSSSTPKKKRPKLRFFGPSDLERHISGPLALESYASRNDSRTGLIDAGPEKTRFDFEPGYFNFKHEKPLSPASTRSLGTVDLTKWPLPPEPLTTAHYDFEKEGGEDSHTDRHPNRRHNRTKSSSYTLFPTRADDIPRLPATIYIPPFAETRLSRLALRRQKRRSGSSERTATPSARESARDSMRDAFGFLSKPAPLFASRHGRSNSSDSSATVQIGLRFSVAPATLAAAKCTAANRALLGAGVYSPRKGLGTQGGDAAAPMLRRDDSDESGLSLGLPIQIPTPSASTVPASDSTSTSTSKSTSTSPLSSLANIAAVQFPQPPNVHVRSKPPVSRMPPRAAVAPTDQQQGGLGMAMGTGVRGKILPPTPRSGRDWEAVGSPPAIVVLPKPPMTPPPRPQGQMNTQGRIGRERMPMTPLGMNPVSPASPPASGLGGSPPESGWI